MEHSVTVSQTEYAERRVRLLAHMPPASLAVVFAASLKRRNGDVEFPFRQKSDFLYLTGSHEPGAVLVMVKDPTGEGKFILFMRPQDPKHAVWTGPRVGVEGALRDLGADHAYTLSELTTVMPTLLEEKETVYYALGESRQADKRMITWSRHAWAKSRGNRRSRQWMDINVVIDELRLYKSPTEIALMREACAISAAAHVRLMRYCQPSQREYELEAEFLHACYRRGCRALAYPPIVGGGANACILHYVDNQAVLQAGDLVLVDAGGEYQGYAADITRTFPVNGVFSAEQKAIYQLVLEAQLAAIDCIRPGVAWENLQIQIVSVLVRGFLKLGILQGDVKTLIEQKAYQPFYMHSSGHWLGLDVHDVGAYKIKGVSRPLEAGMVLTVEPGIYIPSNCEIVAARWRGIGVRIEDDVLVTESGYEVLTAAAPKTIEAVEAACRSAMA